MSLTDGFQIVWLFLAGVIACVIAFTFMILSS